MLQDPKTLTRVSGLAKQDLKTLILCGGEALASLTLKLYEVKVLSIYKLLKVILKGSDIQCPEMILGKIEKSFNWTYTGLKSFL